MKFKHERFWDGSNDQSDSSSSKRGNNSAIHKFYVSVPYRHARKEYKKQHPHCEVCLEVGGRLNPMEYLEHIVPIYSGGAPLDFDNWMSVCKHHADVKNGLESQSGGSIVAYAGSYGGMIPTRRGQVIELLREADNRRMRGGYSPDVPQP